MVLGYLQKWQLVGSIILFLLWGGSTGFLIYLKQKRGISWNFAEIIGKIIAAPFIFIAESIGFGLIYAILKKTSIGFLFLTPPLISAVMLYSFLLNIFNIFKVSGRIEGEDARFKRKVNTMDQAAQLQRKKVDFVTDKAKTQIIKSKASVAKTRVRGQLGVEHVKSISGTTTQVFKEVGNNINAAGGSVREIFIQTGDIVGSVASMPAVAVAEAYVISANKNGKSQAEIERYKQRLENGEIQLLGEALGRDEYDDFIDQLELA